MSTATSLAGLPSQASAPNGFLNTAEVSERFFGGTSPQTIRKYVNDDGLPAHRVNRRFYYDPAEVDEWVRRRDRGGDDHRAAIKRLVDAAPALTGEQVSRIRAVLGGAA